MKNNSKEQYASKLSKKRNTVITFKSYHYIYIYIIYINFNLKNFKKMLKRVINEQKNLKPEFYILIAQNAAKKISKK